MSTRALYRLASVLIVLLDVGHTIGCPWSDPAWGVDLRAVRTTHFPVVGFSRTYAQFYVGFGLSVSVFLVLAALLAWQLGAMPADTRRRMRAISWALALAFAAITVINSLFFFAIPIAFASLITICLAAAAWRVTRAT